jgi:hypothetical protein
MSIATKAVFGVLALTLVAVGTGSSTKKVNPTLASIHSVFVKGNNEAASNLRNKMMKEAEGGKACFAVVGREGDADAVLEVNQEMTGHGMEGNTVVVSGTMTAKDGTLLWSDSKQGVSGIVHTGAGNAAQNLLFSLQRAAGCGRHGREK